MRNQDQSRSPVFTRIFIDRLVSCGGYRDGDGRPTGRRDFTSIGIVFFVFLSLFSVGDGLPLARKMESMEGP